MGELAPGKLSKIKTVPTSPSHVKMYHAKLVMSLAGKEKLEGFCTFLSKCHLIWLPYTDFRPHAQS
jgi:hypothetical protein